MSRSAKDHNELRIIGFTFRKRRIRILMDKVLFLRFLRTLHGRFWGLAGISVMMIGFGVCFLIRPEWLDPATAFSDFGTDVRTAPYFSASVFIAAYGLWRWQGYLSRTWKRSMPVTGLVMLTVIGLYLIALMPVSWHPWPYRIHMFGVVLTGISMLAAVVLDGLLTKIRPHRHLGEWRALRILSITLILAGGYIMFVSSPPLEWYRLSLVGELCLISGYWLWITQKTYLGEGNRTALSRIAKRIVLID